MSSPIVLYAVGDVIPDRDEPGTLFEHVRRLIKRGDIAFCQLESVLSDRGTPLPQARLVARGKREVARAIKEAGFDVVSFASNHCMDLGREAFADTLDALKEQQLAVIGAGANIQEARKPAIVHCRDTRIAFLAYNSILPQAYWAETDRPGCVPLRAFTHYEQIEHDQPGTPCRIYTYPHRDDLNAMVADITQARSKADLVVLSVHWGIHFIPAVLADYQREIAHIAIDSGVDLILGHHAHILKGIEVYKGKVIFYSLCNFAADLRADDRVLKSSGFKEIKVLNQSWVPDPEYPSYFMPPDCRKTMVVKCLIVDRKIKSVSFLPTMINKQSQPEVLQSIDARFGEVLEYVKSISREAGLDTRYTVEGDRVVIGAP